MKITTSSKANYGKITQNSYKFHHLLMTHFIKMKQKQKLTAELNVNKNLLLLPKHNMIFVDFNHENDDKFDLLFQSTSELYETFVCSSDTTYSEREDNVSDFEYTNTLWKPRTDAFLLFWEALHTVFQRCTTCGKPSKVTKLFIIGSALIVSFTCIRQHKNTWRSQKLINRYHNGNITFFLTATWLPHGQLWAGELYDTKVIGSLVMRLDH